MILTNTKDKFIIKGLGGKKTLRGVVDINGAKNAALKLMAASILFKDDVNLKNVPEIEDVKRMADLLVGIGMKVYENKNRRICLSVPKSGCSTKMPGDISKRLRASVVLTGPILARFGEVSFPHPGGCVIGERPIDFFVEGFKKMGAGVKIKNGNYFIKAPSGKLNGATIFLKNQSVTATETFLMSGVLASGNTIIKNASLEPEVEDLANFMSSCGARITGIGTTTLKIKGGALLSTLGKIHTVPPDRIETGSFLVLGALAASELEIKKCEPEHLESLIETLRIAGVKIEVGKSSIKVFGGASNKFFNAVDIKTHEYPGFPTDIQAPMTVFLTQAMGESMVFETIFEGRLNYTEFLVIMGADIKTMDPHRIIIKGPSLLHGKVLDSPDLRAGLAFVIAAIIANGNSEIGNVYNIDRGYEKIEKRLQNIGVDIVRVNDN
jgi:UDP-N-acetylglucosamine 1-carboxyvinyltransferase